MKDAKFIELLNLYVDHEISAAEAALLEAEIQQNPQRREVYREYCRMQKACMLMTDQFRTEAPPAVAGEAIEFAPARRHLTPFVYASGLAAAAACIALVLVNRSGDRAPAVATTPAVAVAPATTPVAGGQTALPALQPAFQGLGRDSGAVAATVVRADGANLDWMTRVQFERVPAESLRFDSPQTAPTDDLVFRSGRVFDLRTEGAAFRFQK